jgi:flagellar biosynthetic protein FliR
VFPLANFEHALALLGLGAARTLPLAWAIPALGGPALPIPVRVALGVGLAVLCYPAIAASAPPPGAVAWALLAAREILVGVVMGFVCGCLFRAAAAAGEIVDVSRGATLADASSPAGESRTSPFGALFLLFACVVFVEIGGIGHVAVALGRSYEAIPLAASLRLSAGARTAALLAMVSSGKLIEAAVGLAAPAMVALLLADLTLGVAGRAVPSLPVHSLGLPLKALLGVGVVLVGLGSLDVALQGGFRGFLGMLSAVPGLAR